MCHTRKMGPFVMVKNFQATSDATGKDLFHSFRTISKERMASESASVITSGKCEKSRDAWVLSFQE